MEWAFEEFGLGKWRDKAAGQLPGGYKQRLAMAASLLHEPDILFLDEPTSGVDPLARREFWLRINGFAEQGVTVVVTTHFMEESEYCDRMLIMSLGESLAMGTPAEIRALARSKANPQPTIEDAFIALAEGTITPSGGQNAGQQKHNETPIGRSREGTGEFLDERLRRFGYTVHQGLLAQVPRVVLQLLLIPARRLRLV